MQTNYFNQTKIFLSTVVARESSLIYYTHNRDIPLWHVCIAHACIEFFFFFFFFSKKFMQYTTVQYIAKDSTI